MIVWSRNLDQVADAVIEVKNTIPMNVEIYTHPAPLLALRGFFSPEHWTK